MRGREKGYVGEELAAEYLRSLGYEIAEQNYTVKGGEIDIIAIDCDTLVFVEVKARASSDPYERPADAIDARKIAFLVRSAERYVFEKKEKCEAMPVRFDCIEVIFCNSSFGKAEINHIKGFDVYSVSESKSSYEYF